jgi:5-methylcytosine-specific restriction enzyme subunit McrC
MTNGKGILIKNIYYMLTYAFRELRLNNYERIAGEEFEDIYDLFAEILCRGIAYLLKQGLHREYVAVRESLPSLRGKLDVSGTLRERQAQRVRLACEHDELSENNLFNRILKSAVMLLLRHSEVDARRKGALRRLMSFFEGVDEIAPSAVRWGSLRYDRNCRSYQMLHGLCYFLLQSRLLTTEEGKTRLAQFSDDHMNLLFQRFVLEYYRRHHGEYGARAKMIRWNLSEESAGSVSAGMLPIMQTDITLSLGERTLIIDTKYYSRVLQENFGKLSLNSPNMYQINAYVTNEDVHHTGRVDGLLLYAMTQEDVQPDMNVVLNDGNRLMAHALNLNQDFAQIKQQLELFTEYTKHGNVTASK